MNRRHFLALTAALPALAAVMQACGGDDQGSTTSTTSVGGDEDAPMQLRSNVGRANVDPALAAVAADAINAFGADLHRQLAAADPDANLVFSPTSILLALAMTRAGAVGVTATEMDEVLHLSGAGDVYAAGNALDAALARVSGPVETAAGEDEVALRIANSLWPQSGFDFEQAFLDVLASQFDAGLYAVDYRTDPDVARVAINGWVDEQTAGRIPDLLGANTLTPATRLTLVNAVYLKAPWQRAFEESATSTSPFTTAGGTTVDVEMMHATRHYGYATGAGWQAVQLPYAGDRLAMLLVLPDADAATLEASGVSWPAAADLTDQKIRLGLPRWDIETSASLGDVLGALGMPTAFTDDADFTGMTTEEPLYIGAVIHQANITVDEAGTEAAAATAVVMEAGAAPNPDQPPVVVFDRPFLFAVRDTQTGAILFQGRVADPSA